jgi:hypothetical protein
MTMSVSTVAETIPRPLRRRCCNRHNNGGNANPQVAGGISIGTNVPFSAFEDLAQEIQHRTP